ncbi:MaoC family dehydratase N-terminal domain-containing protein [Arthrobacter sp. NPDC058097]|uniref:FAS1-like dehydratase domain-containing protein n=1 Tax=Arthrobacter sp. NPDC058097 TaxID=3346340 RepID=UPI0036DA703A
MDHLEQIQSNGFGKSRNIDGSLCFYEALPGEDHVSDISYAIKNEDFSAWVSLSETHADVASRSTALALAALLDRPAPPVEAGQAKLFPLGHWLHFTPTAAHSELGKDGHPRLGGFLPPLPLPRRMWAGSKISFHSPITVGQPLTRTTTIESITPKSGSSGKLCFVVLRHDLRASTVHALTEHQTLVYREAVPLDLSAASSQRPPREATEAPAGWEWSHAFTPDEVNLFMYSALTFNAHRIHYDLPYATGVEGYPGLVVHGPLSASLLVDRFLLEHPGAEITSFEFSARSPVFVGEQIHICGRADGNGAAELAVFAPGGAQAVTARLEYR